jgi:hypothetical protein
MGRDEKARNGFGDDRLESGENIQVHFSDRAGVSWRAFELRRPGQPRALVFESNHAVRLVRDYPANWYTLPRAALEALSWSV